MRDLNLKEMMNSKESHLIMKAFSVDVDELGSNGTQKDDVDILISRLNSRKASIYREWREVTNDFDLDKIKRIILGVERDGKVNLIVKQIIKEYKTLVNAKNRGMTFMKEYLKDSETKFELIPFENILDDYLQQRQEIRDAKHIEYYSKPAETGLTARTENTLLRRTLDEHKATIARQRKKIEEFERVISELDMAINGNSKTITSLRDELDEQEIELAYTKQQLKKTERQRKEDNQQLSLLKGFAAGFKKKNAELQQDVKQKETNICQLTSQIKNIKEKNLQSEKENKELQEEIEKLRKISNTQQEEITQLRQEAETADLFLSAEEAETIAKMRAYGFKGTNKELLDSIRHEEEIMTIEALESKNRELVQKMNELLEEKGNTTVKIEDIIKGLKKIPNPVEQLLVMEKLGFYVFVNTPLGEQIRELIEEMCKNQQEIRNKQNIMINQLVTGNGTQNITNANMG
jgi:chromosome segregation ATPase